MKFCDLRCKYADWPDKPQYGACHTVDGLYCKKHRTVVPKNGRCLDETKGKKDAFNT